MGVIPRIFLEFLQTSPQFSSSTILLAPIDPSQVSLNFPLNANILLLSICTCRPPGSFIFFCRNVSRLLTVMWMFCENLKLILACLRKVFAFNFAHSGAIYRKPWKVPRLLASEGRKPNRSVEFELGDFTLSKPVWKFCSTLGFSEIARRQNSWKSSPTFTLMGKLVTNLVYTRLTSPL